MEKVCLNCYQPQRKIRSKNMIIECLWEVVSFLVMKNPLCVGSGLKRCVLKLFGAKIGKGVVIKQGVKIKYPWKLSVGAYSWIGEDVWLDNIVDISIGEHVCLSQGVYCCTGNHDWSKIDFPLVTKPIIIEDGVWVGAKAVVAPGICLKTHSVIALASVVVSDTQAYQIYQGNPAVNIKQRIIHP